MKILSIDLTTEVLTSIENAKSGRIKDEFAKKNIFNIDIEDESIYFHLFVEFCGYKGYAEAYYSLYADAFFITEFLFENEKGDDINTEYDLEYCKIVELINVEFADIISEYRKNNLEQDFDLQRKYK